jgi:hypothetical protein
VTQQLAHAVFQFDRPMPGSVISKHSRAGAGTDQPALLIGHIPEVAKTFL